MALRAVFFDYGETLVSTGTPLPDLAPESLDGLVQALLPSLPLLDGERLRRDFAYLRAVSRRWAAAELLETPAVVTLRLALDLQGLAFDEALLLRGVDGYFAAEEALYAPIEGMREALAELKRQRLKLGLISNATSPELVCRVLGRFNMLLLLDAVVISAEVGRRKPHPVIFEQALQRLGVAPSDAAMVGDLPEADIEGARAIGCRSILVDFLRPGRRAANPGPAPDAVVHSPTELLAALRKM
jgi:HAD superfamily hydrolase (TIGR01509 family)